MKGFDKIIESLDIVFRKAGHVRMLRPLMMDDFYDVENTLVWVHRGTISYTQGAVRRQAAAGDILLIPGGKATTLTYGVADWDTWDKAYFADNRSRFLQSLQGLTSEAAFDHCSYITFDVRAFHAVNFFTLLDLPPFTIRHHPHLSALLGHILAEHSTPQVGSRRMIKADTERLIIEIIRHLIANHLFEEKMTRHSQRLQDPRLVKLFTYIRDNLKGNLSNYTLATIAHVSEDYVGQYFKLLTGVTPQDYIAYQRMEQAVRLLRTTSQRIQDVGKAVGFKDTAYFCRRFKMMFGISAGKMRQQALGRSSQQPGDNGHATY